LLCNDTEEIQPTKIKMIVRFQNQ